MPKEIGNIKMNWNIFREIVQDYIKKERPDLALEFMKEWNVIDKDSKLKHNGSAEMGRDSK